MGAGLPEAPAPKLNIALAVQTFVRYENSTGHDHQDDLRV